MLPTRSAQPTKPRWLRRLGAIVSVLVVAVVIAITVRSLLYSGQIEPRTVQKITLIQTPPPPPPKPPEKPPEPPKPREEVKVDTPQQAPKPADSDAPPPGPLGLDAQGSGPGDGFGLAARPGGRDIVGSAVGAQMALNLFANGTARHIAQELARLGPLRQVNYRVELRIWLAVDGRIERFEVARGSGDAKVDQLIRDGLAQVGPLRQSVPEGMQQPLRIRVTSTDA